MSSETADANSDDGANIVASTASDKEKTQEKKPYNKPGPKPKRKRFVIVLVSFIFSP